MPAAPYVLAVDLGTSGAKAALVTFQGRIAGWAFAPVDTHILPGGGAEQDPEDWWRALRQATAELLRETQADPKRITALCCNTQGEGTLPVDANGRPLMRCILWMDARGAGPLNSITHGPVRIAGYHAWRLLHWIRLTGGAPSHTGKDPAAHMLYIRDQHPEIYEKTAAFLNVPDYLNFRLTGRIAASVDSILTSWVTDNRDANHVRYSKRLIGYSGIDPAKFPPIVQCTEVLGPLNRQAAEDLGLSPSVQVVAGAIDTTAAAIGSGAVEDFAPHLYVGTSSWLAAHVPFKKTDIIHSLAAVPCAIPGRYLLTALQATAGGNLTFLRDQILYHKDELLVEENAPDVYKIMDRIAARVPAGSNGVVYTPWIYGERAPVDDHLIRAGIHNLSLENSREDLIRAIFEGVAFNTRWLLRPVERFMKRRVDVINIVGGGGASQVWRQIFADVLNRPIRQVKDPIQANVRGSAFIAGVGLGKISFADIPELMEYTQTHSPNPAYRACYEERFEIFVRLYKQNRALYHQLNRRPGVKI